MRIIGGKEETEATRAQYPLKAIISIVFTAPERHGLTR